MEVFFSSCMFLPYGGCQYVPLHGGYPKSIQVMNDHDIHDFALNKTWWLGSIMPRSAPGPQSIPGRRSAKAPSEMVDWFTFFHPLRPPSPRGICVCARVVHDVFIKPTSSSYNCYPKKGATLCGISQPCLTLRSGSFSHSGFIFRWSNAGEQMAFQMYAISRGSLLKKKQFLRGPTSCLFA